MYICDFVPLYQNYSVVCSISFELRDARICHRDKPKLIDLDDFDSIYMVDHGTLRNVYLEYISEPVGGISS